MNAINPEQLKADLDKSERVFLKLWKKGCGICKLSNSATDRLEADNTHNLKFVKINVDDHPQMLDLADSNVLPLFFVFADKKKQGQYIGFKGLDKLKEFVEGCFSE